MKKTLLFLTALLSCIFVYAQQGEIIYTDFEPDLFVQYYAWEGPGHINAPLELDINHDSTIDLRFTCEGAWGHWVDCVLRKSEDGWQFKLPYLLYQEDDAAPVGDTVNFGDNIAEIGNGWTSAYRFRWFMHNGPIYPDYNDIHHYICVRREVEEGYCYGWIDSNILLVVGDDVFTEYEFDVTVFRMAYCTIPNYPLCVGQIDFTDGIDETEAFATVYPNPTKGLVTVMGRDLKAVQVVNTLGQCVATAQGEGERLTVDISSLPFGVYFVNITDSEGRKCVRRVVKE